MHMATPNDDWRIGRAKLVDDCGEPTRISGFEPDAHAEQPSWQP
jgi:hypothetical protein